MGGKYFCCVVFNLLHGFVETTASGLVEQKTPSLIITYTGTLIESTCDYNRALWKWLWKLKSFFPPHSPTIYALVCCAPVNWWRLDEANSFFFFVRKTKIKRESSCLHDSLNFKCNVSGQSPWHLRSHCGAWPQTANLFEETPGLEQQINSFIVTKDV